MCSETLTYKSKKVSKRALDMLLLSKEGVCGMLNLNKTEHCATVHNAVALAEEAQGRIKRNCYQSLQDQESFLGVSTSSWIMSVSTLILGTQRVGEVANATWVDDCHWICIFNDLDSHCTLYDCSCYCFCLFFFCCFV